ncbi:MAG: 5'-methylthioadenosine/S-adenosylhomocysteine nucleosidase [Actinomycetaceae bacterium]|nr:5'-methylthioadenosine/S-adenosylhomocysteine nucleosidase [Actinomycetaceae bacterium]
MDILRTLQVETHGETIVIATAMEMEAAPFVAELSDATETEFCGQTWRVGTWHGRRVCIITTGIGLVNAASAATRAHLLFGDKLLAYICAGTTGGLSADVAVTDAIIGTQFVYSRADATAFGYAPGQVPGLPAVFKAGSRLTSIADSLPSSVDFIPEGEDASNSEGVGAGTEAEGAAGTGAEGDAGAGSGKAAPTPIAIRVGQVSSSDAFVTSETVERTRELFPLALGADMESAAAAQVCAMAGVEFISVRGVSDLCGPTAGQDFHVDGSVAARVSATVVEHVLAKL